MIKKHVEKDIPVAAIGSGHATASGGHNRMGVGENVDPLMRSNAGADAWLETIDLTGRNEIREDLADLGLGIVSDQIEMAK